MSTSRIDQTITIGQARRAPPGSPERAAFDEALAPAVAAVRAIQARMRPAARLIAERAAVARQGGARKPLRPAAAPSPRPAPRARQRRASAPRKAASATADPDPASRSPAPAGQGNHHHADLERAQGASGERMSEPEHIADVIGRVLARVAARMERRS